MTKKTEMPPPPCHQQDLPRLNRIGGQIDGVKKMIEDGRYCPDILTQLRAVRSALKSVEANILERHLNGCVNEAMKSNDSKVHAQKLEELKDLFKKFDD